MSATIRSHCERKREKPPCCSAPGGPRRPIDLARVSSAPCCASAGRGSDGFERPADEEASISPPSAAASIAPSIAALLIGMRHIRWSAAA